MRRGVQVNGLWISNNFITLGGDSVVETSFGLNCW